MKYKALLFTLCIHNIIIPALRESQGLSFNNNPKSKTQENTFCERQIKIVKKYAKEIVTIIACTLLGHCLGKLGRYAVNHRISGSSARSNTPDSARPLNDNRHEDTSDSNGHGCSPTQLRTISEALRHHPPLLSSFMRSQYTRMEDLAIHPLVQIMEHLPRDLAQIAEEYRTPTTVTITTTRDAYSSIPVEVDDNNDTQGRLISLDNRQIYPAKIIEAIDSFYAHTNSPCIQVSSRGLLLAERAANGTITGARNIQYSFLANYPHVDIFVGNPGEELKRRI